MTRIGLVVVLAMAFGCDSDDDKRARQARQDACEKKWHGTLKEKTRAELVATYGAKKVRDGKWRGECTTNVKLPDVDIQIVWNDCETRESIKSVFHHCGDGAIAEQHNL